MNNTKRSFKDKWEKNPTHLFSETRNPNSDIYEWIMERNGWKDEKGLIEVLRGKRRILDAGCGNGRCTALLRECSESSSIIVGLDPASHEIARNNLSGYHNVDIYDADLLNPDSLKTLGKFDYIYCQEVLHHTSDPQLAFSNLTQILNDDGIVAIYVYKLKAPIREFTDDYVRNCISDLSYDDSMEHMKELTEFGKCLAEKNITVCVPQVKILGVEQGEYDLQRLFYHFFCKMFWNHSYSFEDNTVVNYDWYHPDNASRHTMDEVLDWFKDSSLEVIHKIQDHYGITIHGKKTANEDSLDLIATEC